MARSTSLAMLLFSMCLAQVRTHILDVVRDILMRYDVDGIHFDDYFYPYPVAGQTFDDAATYSAYTSGGGKLAKDDWRRFNVDELVRETSELVTKTRASVRFGVSPFGIYRPGTPAGITGLDAYATLYCDPVRWMNEAWHVRDRAHRGRRSEDHDHARRSRAGQMGAQHRRSTRRREPGRAGRGAVIRRDGRLAWRLRPAIPAAWLGSTGPCRDGPCC